MTAGTTTVEPPTVPPADAPRRRTGWPHDVVLGVRLAVGGGRTSWARLVLGTIGIGLATTVLLIAASVGHFTTSESIRSHAAFVNEKAVPGVAPLDLYYGSTQYRDVAVMGAYVRATGPNSPVPPGVARVPGPGEVVLSPALADLLNSPDGALLRPRFPQRVIGLIDQAGLTGPQSLSFYAGPTDEQVLSASQGASRAQRVYSFGQPAPAFTSNAALLVMAIVGAVALLVPILIMVSVSSRIAGLQRDRRLAALRLVGAGSRQVRRIAAAESLVSAATGLVLGAAAFLVFRQIVPSMELDGISAFTSDITPPLPLIVLIVLVVPLLAVVTALVAMRRTVIEPLGVVRGGRTVRRRLWWRAGLMIVGVGLLLVSGRLTSGHLVWVADVAAGSAALLIGVPVVLPWLLERAVARIRGGAPSWQLAVRRLQLDSGTPARVVGGVAVVLAGAIALQSVLIATAGRVDLPTGGPAADTSNYIVESDSVFGPKIDATLRQNPLVRDIESTTLPTATTDVAHAEDNLVGFQVASCAAIRHMGFTTACADGDVFTLPDMGETVAAGTRLTFVTDPMGGSGAATPYGSWTVPANVRTLREPAQFYGPAAEFVVTPGAIAGVRLPPVYETYSTVSIDPTVPDGIEYLRNAGAADPLNTYVDSTNGSVELNVDQRTFVTIRNVLLVGSLFTLLLAGVSLLVLALEQVRERRRPLAMLSASGVSRAVLARSLLWQTAVPVVLGVVAAVGTGIGLAALLLRSTSTDMRVDWVVVGVFSAAAVALALLVTAATLPALRNATRLSALRTE